MRRAASPTCGYARAVLAGFLILTPGAAAAHPHVFIDDAGTVLVVSDAVEGIRLTPR